MALIKDVHTVVGQGVSMLYDCSETDTQDFDSNLSSLTYDIDQLHSTLTQLHVIRAK